MQSVSRLRPAQGVERVFRPVSPPRPPFPPSQHPLPASVLHIEMPPPPSSAGWCLHSSRESSSRRALRTAPPVARCPLPGPFVPTPPPGCTCKKGRTSGGPADAAKTANGAGGIKGGMNDAKWGVSDEMRRPSQKPKGPTKLLCPFVDVLVQYHLIRIRLGVLELTLGHMASRHHCVCVCVCSHQWDKRNRC